LARRGVTVMGVKESGLQSNLAKKCNSSRRSIEREYVSQKLSLSLTVAHRTSNELKGDDRTSVRRTIDKIFKISVYQVLILPAQYLAHSWVTEKDFTPGRKDEDDGLAQLCNKEICPVFASGSKPP